MRLGGVLPQCIHAGFGLQTFGEELTGPEYAARYADEIKKRQIDVRLESYVTSIGDGRTLTVFSGKDGAYTLKAGAVVLAVGCRERPAGALTMDGPRIAGIMTAGTAQRYINIDGYMVGRRVVILGSGDIGLIMARRLTLEGAEVVCVCELMPWSNGLQRNIVQCLEDFNIPLYCSTTVVGVTGKERVTGVWAAPVDEEPPAGSGKGAVHSLRHAAAVCRTAAGNSTGGRCRSATGKKRRHCRRRTAKNFGRRCFCLRKCGSGARLGGLCGRRGTDGWQKRRGISARRQHEH